MQGPAPQLMAARAFGHLFCSIPRSQEPNTPGVWMLLRHPPEMNRLPGRLSTTVCSQSSVSSFCPSLQNFRENLKGKKLSEVVCHYWL